MLQSLRHPSGTFACAVPLSSGISATQCPPTPVASSCGAVRRRSPKAVDGFTLIELLVVIAILALIASFAAPQVFKWLGDSKSKSALVQIETLSSGIDLYRLEVGFYPPSLNALVSQPGGVDRWNGPYLRKSVIPNDPWGNPFEYQFPGEHGPFDLASRGADNALGGEGENRDVVSWE
ncbi:MAG: general secretion pathway protein G [Gammaproteobacteria bacterium]